MIPLKMTSYILQLIIKVYVSQSLYPISILFFSPLNDSMYVALISYNLYEQRFVIFDKLWELPFCFPCVCVRGVLASMHARIYSKQYNKTNLRVGFWYEFDHLG